MNRIKLHIDSGRDHHLWTWKFLLWVPGELKEHKLSLTVEDRDCNSPAVPAEQVKINQHVRDAPIMQILPDSVGQPFIIVGCEFEGGVG